MHIFPHTGTELRDEVFNVILPKPVDLIMLYPGCIHTSIDVIAEKLPGLMSIISVHCSRFAFVICSDSRKTRGCGIGIKRGMRFLNTKSSAKTQLQITESQPVMSNVVVVHWPCELLAEWCAYAHNQQW